MSHCRCRGSGGWGERERNSRFSAVSVILRKSLVEEKDRELIHFTDEKNETQRRELVLHETALLASGGDRICTPV